MVVPAIIVFGIVACIVRPRFAKKLFREFSQKRYMLSAAAFVTLLCGTVFVATQAPSESNLTKNSKAQTSPVRIAPAPDDGESVQGANTFGSQNDPQATEQNDTARPLPQQPGRVVEPAAPAQQTTQSSKSPSAPAPGTTETTANAGSQAPAAQAENTSEKKCTAKLLNICVPAI